MQLNVLPALLIIFVERVSASMHPGKAHKAVEWMCTIEEPQVGLISFRCNKNLTSGYAVDLPRQVDIDPRASVREGVCKFQRDLFKNPMYIFPDELQYPRGVATHHQCEDCHHTNRQFRQKAQKANKAANVTYRINSRSTSFP